MPHALKTWLGVVILVRRLVGEASAAVGDKIYFLEVFLRRSEDTCPIGEMNTACAEPAFALDQRTLAPHGANQHLDAHTLGAAWVEERVAQQALQELAILGGELRGRLFSVLWGIEDGTGEGSREQTSGAKDKGMAAHDISPMDK